MFSSTPCCFGQKSSKQKPSEHVIRRRKQLPDKPTTKGPGQDLVAWKPFGNRHADPGSVLVCVRAPVAVQHYPPPCFYE